MLTRLRVSWRSMSSQPIALLGLAAIIALAVIGFRFETEKEQSMTTLIGRSALPPAVQIENRYIDNLWSSSSGATVFSGPVLGDSDEIQLAYKTYILASISSIMDRKGRTGRISAVFSPDQSFSVTVSPVIESERLGLALLELGDVGGLPVVKIGDSQKINIGDPLYAAGAFEGIPFKLSKGMLGEKDHGHLWRHDFSDPLDPGSAIFDDEGNFVAMATEPGISVPVEEIKRWLHLNGYGFILGPEDTTVFDWLSKKAE